MKNSAIRGTIADAIGETKRKATIGSLISVLIMTGKVELAMLRGDRLATRLAVRQLCDFMGWNVTPTALYYMTAR